MQSPMMPACRRATKTFRDATLSTVLSLAAFATSASPILALPITPIIPLQQELNQNSALTEVAVRRTTTVVRPNGAVRRTTVVRPGGGGAVVRRGAVVRPGVRPGVVAGGWVRPSRYYWRPGGAIAAGAAIGFVAAATAAAWAGAPPAPGYCWYYTDPGRTQGFWDVCP
jgi:hypothetical protein